MHAEDERRLLDCVPTAYLCLTALFAAGACAVALRDQMTVPYADDWRILDHYQSRPLLQYLFGAENGHRLPATLALLAIDHEWFGGRMRTLVLASIACTALATGLLWRILWKQGRPHRALARSVFAFASFALFWAVSCNDLLRGIYHMSLQALLLAVIALAALAEVDPRRIPASRRRLGVAGLAAFLATWSHGVGAACWAALVAVAAVRRFPARVVAGLAAAGAATIALHAATLPADPKQTFAFETSVARLARDPAAVAGAALAFLGTAPARVASGLGLGAPYPPQLRPGPWAAHTRDLQRISVAFGAVGLLVSSVLVAGRRRRPLDGSALDTLVVGLPAFAVAAALLVSFVRVPTQGTSGVLHARFLLFSTLFWIGIACALLPRTPEAIAGRFSWLAVLALPIVSASMLPALRDARAFHAATRSQASKLTLSLLLGLRNDELARSVSLEDAETVHRVASRLEAERRWPFEGARYGLRGIPLRERFAPSAPCVGELDRAWSIDAIEAAAVAGWLARAPDRPPPTVVVLVDRSGVIRGLADFASVPPALGAGMREDALAWTGFVADYDPAQRYAAYAVLGREDTACPLRAP
jgi:hypothetical protein